MLLEASNTLGEYTHLIKVTGRLRVLNTAAIVTRSGGLNVHDLLIPPVSNFARIDTRFFVAPPSAINEWMSEISPMVRDELGADFESRSWQWLVNSDQKKWNIRVMDRTPAFVGRSGTSGQSFSRIKAVSRVVLETSLNARVTR